MIYNNANDIRNISDIELEEFLKRYWKTQSFDFYGEFVPEKKVASFNCGVMTHVKVPGTSQLMSYPFIKKGISFKIPARYRIKTKGYYKFSCKLAPINIRKNSNNSTLLQIDYDTMSEINDSQYKRNISDNAIHNHTMSEQERKWFKELSEIKATDVKTLTKKDYQGVWDSVISKYPESAHFVYELLQNADDAKAESAEFILRKDSLIFIHNGKRHFNITDPNIEDGEIGDINAIVNIGNNFKDGVATIGKFGVGFKSIFQYTDAPEIYDDVFKFKINNYIIPLLLNHDFPLRKEGQTLFYIPFKEESKDYINIKKRLNSLKSPILFLRNLKEVKWKEEDDLYFQEYTKSVQTLSKDEGKGIEISLITERTGNNESKLYMFKRIVEVTKNNFQPIFVGFYLNDDMSLNTKVKPKVFCFFQTSVSFGLPFISHAPFLTTDNRDGLLPDNDVNDFLVEQLAKLAADSLICLRDLGIKQNKSILTIDSLFDIIPVKYANYIYTEGISLMGETLDISPFYKYLTQKVKTEYLLCSVNDEYLSIYDALLAERYSLRSLINRDQLNFLLSEGERNGVSSEELRQINSNAVEKSQIPHMLKDFIKDSTNSDVRTYMAEVLNIPRFTNRIFAACITPTFMQKQSKEWVLKLYNYIYKYVEYRDIDYFLHSPIIKTQKGEWKSAFNNNNEEIVYLPLNESKSTNEQYDFISSDLYNENPDFFESTMDLKQPNVFDFIRTSIIPHYNKTEGYNDDVVLSDFRTLMKVFFEAKEKEEKYREELNQAKLKGSDMVDINELIALISSKIPFKAKEGGFFYSNVLYEGDNIINKYYSRSNLFHELDLNFYIQDSSEWNKTKVLSFIHSIGIDKKHPKILYNEYTEGARIYCDYFIAEFNISPKTLQTSILIWKSVISQSELFDKNIHYRNQSEQTHRFRKVDHIRYSTIYKQLHDTPWITDANGNHYLPSEISRDEFHRLGYQDCEEIESEIEVGKVAIEELAHQKAVAAEKQREDNNAIIDLYKGNLEEAQKAKELYESISNSGVSMDTVNAFLEYLRQRKKEDLEDQETDERFGNNFDDNDFKDAIERGKRVNVIKTEHFIGLKLFEGYLKKKDLKYEVLDQNEDGYDLKVEQHELVGISVIKDKEINTDKHSPINVTGKQHGLMTSHGINQFTIIRIALKDLGLNFDKEIRDLWGADADIDNDDLFKHKCERFAENYWKGKSAEEFEQMTAKYLVKVTREI